MTLGKARGYWTVVKDWREERKHSNRNIYRGNGKGNNISPTLQRESLFDFLSFWNLLIPGLAIITCCSTSLSESSFTVIFEKLVKSYSFVFTFHLDSTFETKASPENEPIIDLTFASSLYCSRVRTYVMTTQGHNLNLHLSSTHSNCVGVGRVHDSFVSREWMFNDRVLKEKRIENFLTES